MWFVGNTQHKRFTYQAAMTGLFDLSTDPPPAKLQQFFLNTSVDAGLVPWIISSVSATSISGTTTDTQFTADSFLKLNAFQTLTNGSAVGNVVSGIFSFSISSGLNLI